MNDGGPAFPTKSDIAFWDGMTIRDYFAAMAMCGKLRDSPMQAPKDLAEYSYRVADAMLAERSKGEGR